MIRTARWVLYAGFAVFLALSALDVRNPEAIILAVVVLGVLAVSRWSIRERLHWALDRSRVLRGIDPVLGNAILAFLLVEGFLAFADRVSSNPLLMSPNARSQERNSHYKDELRDRMEGESRNSQGFNDTEWKIPKPAGTFRIVALGDSFAFGIVGYEANFLTLLERQLADEGHEPVEVCNLGIPALEPIDYLQILTLEGRMLEPDLVLVCLFSGNDFVRTGQGSRLRLRNTRTFAVLWRLLRLHQERVRRERQVVPPEWPKEGPGQPHPLSRESYLEVAERYVEFLRRDHTPETDQKVADSLAVLDRIAGLVGYDRLVIAVLPNEVQVNPHLRKEICRLLSVQGTDLDLEQPGRWVTEHFRSSGAVVIDLLPSFIAAERRQGTYYPNDTHWNAYGNSVTAAALSAPVAAAVRRLPGGPR